MLHSFIILFVVHSFNAPHAGIETTSILSPLGYKTDTTMLVVELCVNCKLQEFLKPYLIIDASKQIYRSSIVVGDFCS